MSQPGCRFVAPDQPRAINGRHEDHCEDDDCRGCLPCDRDHCRLCGRIHCDTTHPQTCPECVGAVRDDLIEARDLCVHLRERALNGSNAHGRRFASMALPGGDPLVLLGPVGDGSADVMLRWAPVYDPEHPDADDSGYRDASDDDNGHLGSLELPGDPEPPLLTLATWEDDWRLLMGHEAGGRADYWAAASYLLNNLTWAAQRHDAFDEFAGDIRRLRRQLENALADGDRDEVTQVPCLTCGARLVKVYAKQAKDDHHKCPRCKRQHGSGEFERAKRQHMTSDDADAWILLTDAAKSLGRSPHTLRTWVAKGRVRTDREVIEGEGGVMVRVSVWWPDVRQADLESGRRVRTA